MRRGVSQEWYGVCARGSMWFGESMCVDGVHQKGCEGSHEYVRDAVRVR